MVRLFSATFVALLALSSATGSAAQGVQTGSVRGVVKDTTGQVVPQVTVRAESPAQQGARVTTSDAAGAYLLQGLAPGAVLHVLATDPGSVRDFQAFCEATGHTLVEQSEEGGAYSFRLR